MKNPENTDEKQPGYQIEDDDRGAPSFEGMFTSMIAVVWGIIITLVVGGAVILWKVFEQHTHN